jgi:hypothetical protein
MNTRKRRKDGFQACLSSVADGWDRLQKKLFNSSFSNLLAHPFSRVFVDRMQTYLGAF